jgi:hypothetical protein
MICAYNDGAPTQPQFAPVRTVSYRSVRLRNRDRVRENIAIDFILLLRHGIHTFKLL